MDSSDSEIELLHSKTDERSVTQASEFIAHRSRLAKTAMADFPADWLFGFFPSLYQDVRRRYHGREIRHLNPMHPVSIFEGSGTQLAFVFPGFGAPLAGAILDEAIALGAERILFFGKAGSLDPQIPMGGMVLPTSAVRDEGTSFHYLMPGRHSHPDAQLAASIEAAATSRSTPFWKGPVWTTDAPYRETPSQIKRLQSEGCLAVDMETSALFAIGRHYGKKVAGFLTVSDWVSETGWTPGRFVGDTQSTPAGLLDLAVEAMTGIRPGK